MTIHVGQRLKSQKVQLRNTNSELTIKAREVKRKPMTSLA